MTINLFFLTISIAKREISIEEIQRKVRTEKILNEMKDRQFSMYRSF
ncbi:YrzI family small protein [Ferdinandcohnia quinoae]|uniref:YrzI family small protein n=1 Tax=Fredinandcohnia quinoae TaxID=2918902 RepID=A0AAW5E395_9BACI|nr:YrzI family small protein [Fredinandcohnia sp. SECRCQ15]MCH1627391.1 YrzI family small protein [Fredinandcohnia sp. SECRCQ15]